jgi:hypothetical protein
MKSKSLILLPIEIYGRIYTQYTGHSSPAPP